MRPEKIELLEKIGLDLGIAAIFILIGLSIHDVLKKSDVPRFGRIIVWSVLCFGCAGFIAKGIIQYYWENQGFG